MHNTCARCSCAVLTIAYFDSVFRKQSLWDYIEYFSHLSMEAQMALGWEGSVCTSIHSVEALEPKQIFRMLHSLSNPSSFLCYLNLEHLCSINPFCIFLHSGFR